MPRRAARGTGLEVEARHLDRAGRDLARQLVRAGLHPGRKAGIFHRDGFVVVRDLLNAEQLSRFREGCARVLREILSVPGKGKRKYMAETGRLPHRYSYGTSSASRQMLHPITASDNSITGVLMPKEVEQR